MWFDFESYIIFVEIFYVMMITVSKKSEKGGNKRGKNNLLLKLIYIYGNYFEPMWTYGIFSFIFSDFR